MKNEKKLEEEKVLVAAHEPLYDPSETFLSRDLLKKMVENEKKDPKKR